MKSPLIRWALTLCLALAMVPFSPLFALAESQSKASKSQQSGIPRIAFSLTDHTDRPVTADTYKGKFSLVYFGYTFCPDICPTTLADVASVLDRLGDNAGQLAALFISVDSERDTPRTMSPYVAQFHPQIIGLSGTKPQIRDATESFGAPYAIREVDGEVKVGHTGSGFFSGPDGILIAIFPYGMPPDFMASEITQFMADWRKNKDGNKT